MDLLERYTAAELMIVEVSRFIEDNTLGVVGVGLGQQPALLALETHAPGIVIAYEGGQIAPTQIGRAAVGIDDSVLQADAECQTDLLHTLGWLTAAPISHSNPRGRRTDWTLLGAGQVDKYGNINSTVIGNYYHPRIRFPGSGGAHDLATGANKVYIVTRHNLQSLVDRLDYWTSPGHGMDGKLREQLYLPGKGPVAIFTDKCTLMPNEDNEFILKRIQPHTSIEEVKADTGWDLKVAEELETIEAPPENYIKVLREKLDPEGRITGWRKLIK